MTLPPPEVLDRLRKIIGMLGSEHDGERAAASAMANRIMAQYRLTWADIVLTSAPAARPQPPPPPPQRPAWSPPPPSGDPFADYAAGRGRDYGPIPYDIPDDYFTDNQLRAAAQRAVEEDARGLYDLGGTDFLRDVYPQAYWSPRQRSGLVRSLRRAWVLRKQAGYR